jgi:hypothetical protein
LEERHRRDGERDRDRVEETIGRDIGGETKRNRKRGTDTG